MTPLLSAPVIAPEPRPGLDPQGIETLRRHAREAPEQALRQVARQFEALFMHMVIKSMRDATESSGLLESQSGRTYLSMFDQQLAQQLSARGVGLADRLYEQLRTGAPARGSEAATADPRAGAAAAAAAVAAPRPAPAPAPAPAQEAGRPAGPADAARPAGTGWSGLQSHVEAFVSRIRDAARAASSASGVPAPLIVAQAGLESGWGRREIRGDDGSPSFNLFGIKADRSWRGPVVETTTTEVIDGVVRRVRAAFRAYGSYEEAFSDYARFLRGNPRYAPVLAASSADEAARGLQRAGYATDPAYGEKLVRIMRALGQS